MTAHSDYSLRMLLYLAIHGDDGATVGEVADAYDLSRHHLMKVAQKLAKLGLVDATRGRGGGLRLAVPPVEIRLGELVRATETDLDLVECFDPERDNCRISPACRLKPILGEAVQAFLATLDRYTLADLLGNRTRLAGLLEITPARPSASA